jgi:hypothetical protein
VSEEYRQVQTSSSFVGNLSLDYESIEAKRKRDLKDESSSEEEEEEEKGEEEEECDLDVVEDVMFASDKEMIEEHKKGHVGESWILISWGRVGSGRARRGLHPPRFQDEVPAGRVCGRNRGRRWTGGEPEPAVLRGRGA